MRRNTSVNIHATISRSPYVSAAISLTNLGFLIVRLIVAKTIEKCLWPAQHLVRILALLNVAKKMFAANHPNSLACSGETIRNFIKNAFEHNLIAVCVTQLQIALTPKV